MNKKHFSFLFVTLLLPITTLSISNAANATDMTPQIYQFGSGLALVNGIYSSDIPFSDVKKVESFGLGTDEGLGGELVEVNNKFYLANYEGGATELSLATKTPFFMTTSFQNSQKCVIAEINSYKDFETN